MGHRRDLTTIFAQCFRLIVKLGVSIDDAFFVDLLERESGELLNQYLNFLKCQGTSGEFNDVAQYVNGLVYNIKKVLDLLDILKHLGFARSTTPLFLERSLLLLESMILDDNLKRTSTNKKKSSVHSELDKNISNALIVPDYITDLHKDIAKFVSSKGKVQNKEVFTKFSGIARRTLKRKLSELIKAGIVKRTAKGKNVFYATSVNKTFDNQKVV